MDSGSRSTGGDESPRGLNFGEKIFYGNLVGGGGSSSASPQEKSASHAAPPRCQVEGCGIDLTGTKAYYCRHKVCGPHSKSPVVVVAGQEQRFCQQCSRFHQLQEFDQGKRSCRRRLAGHNERRRKPLLGPIGRRLPQPQGPHLPPFQGGGGIHMDFSHPGGGLPPPPWLGGTAGPNGFGHLQALSGGTLLSHSGEGLGLSDPGCALSLLSTQLLDYSGGTATRNLASAPGYAGEPWGLRRHDEGASANSDDGQLSSEPHPDAAMGGVSGFSREGTDGSCMRIRFADDLPPERSSEEKSKCGGQSPKKRILLPYLCSLTWQDLAVARSLLLTACGGLLRTNNRRAAIRKLTAKKGLVVRADVNFVNAEEAKRLVSEENFSVLDVRDKTQFDRAHIQSSYHIPLFVENKDSDPGTIVKRTLHNNFSGLFYGLPFTKPNPEFVQSIKEQFSSDSKILLVCQEGLRSAAAANKLEEEGFQNISCLTSGLQSVKPGVFPSVGPTQLQDAGKAGLVTVQGKISAVLGTVLICAYLFITFFPDQAEKLFQLSPVS